MPGSERLDGYNHLLARKIARELGLEGYAFLRLSPDDAATAVDSLVRTL